LTRYGRICRKPHAVEIWDFGNIERAERTKNQLTTRVGHQVKIVDLMDEEKRNEQNSLVSPQKNTEMDEKRLRRLIEKWELDRKLKYGRFVKTSKKD